MTVKHERVSSVDHGPGSGGQWIRYKDRGVLSYVLLGHWIKSS